MMRKGIPMKYYVHVCACLLMIATPGMLQADDPPPTQPVNMSFEMPSLAAGIPDDGRPDGWFWFSSTNELNITVTDARRKDGLQSCKFTAQKDPDTYQGIAQRFAATPGHHYSFTAHAMNEPQNALAGESYGQISIEWQTAEGHEISRVHGPSWNFELPFSRWTKFSVDAVAPENAVMGVVVVTFFSRNSGGHGVFYVDDCGFGSRSGSPR